MWDWLDSRTWVITTLLSRVTNAKPKIANYHFTTLNPNLGVVDLAEGNGFVIADIPGIIEGHPKAWALDWSSCGTLSGPK